MICMAASKRQVVLGISVLGVIVLFRVVSFHTIDALSVQREILRTSVVQRLVTPEGSGLFIAVPAGVLPNSTAAVFKLAEKGKEAARVQVKFGREYLGFIEVGAGLSEGDEVIISDMSAYDDFDRIMVS